MGYRGKEGCQSGAAYSDLAAAFLGFWFPRSPVEILTLFQPTLFAAIRPDGKQGQGSPPRTLVIATTFSACGNHTFPHPHTFPATSGFGGQGRSLHTGSIATRVLRMYMCAPLHISHMYTTHVCTTTHVHPILRDGR